MSWDSYLDNLIAQTKDASGSAHCDRACIIGVDGGGGWTTAGHANALKVSDGNKVINNIIVCTKYVHLQYSLYLL